MPKLGAAERQAQIVDLLSNNGTMKIMDLASHFQVSRETIRRDLIVLNQAGTVKKWFGGAIPIYDYETRPVDARMKEQEESKAKICEKAMELLQNQSVLFLDTGSTTLCLARMLKETAGHTIISNSIPVIYELLGSSHQLIVTGGSVNQQVSCATGTQTIEFLEQIRVDVAVLGSSGFDRHKGPTGNTFDDCQIKQAAIRNAQTSIVLADSSKAHYSSLTQYASWQEIDRLITDADFPDEMRRRLEEMTSVVVA